MVRAEVTEEKRAEIRAEENLRIAGDLIIEPRTERAPGMIATHPWIIVAAIIVIGALVAFLTAPRPDQFSDNAFQLFR